MAHGLIRLIDQHGYDQVKSEYPINPVEFVNGFVGASGEFVVNANGDRDQSFVIRNIADGNQVRDVFRVSMAPQSSNTNATGQVTLVPLAPVVYPGSSLAKPKDHVTQSPLNVDWRSVSGALLGAVTSLVIATIVLSTLYLFFHREVPQVKHLSFPFLCVISCGCVVTLASTLMSLGEPTTVTQCQLSAWAFVYGIELTVGASIVKAWRILSIFQNKTMAKIMPIRNQTLFVGLGIILLGQSIILLVFSVVSPLEPSVISGRDWRYVACQNRESTFRLPLIVTNTAYNGLLILALELLAFKTRNISSSFSESKYLHLTAQTVTMSSVVVTVLSVFDFGQSTWSAFVAKHALILSAVTFVFMYLVGRLAVQVYWDMKDEGSPDGEGTGDEWAIKSLSEEKLGGGGGVGIAMSPSRNRLRSNSNLAGATDAVLFRGKFPVLEKRFLYFTSRWVQMRVWLILSEALLTMTPTTNSTEALLATTILLNRSVINPNPAHAPNCLELFCDGRSWLIQCVSREEHKVWVERIGCVAKTMESSSATGSSQDLGSDRSLTSGGATPGSSLAVNTGAAGGGDKNRSKPVSPMGLGAMMVRLKTAPLLGSSPMTPLMAHKEEDGVGALGSNGEVSSSTMGMTREALAKAFNRPYDPDAV
ncbi:7 transmembrane sweet-taste receptor of 3 GCPR-domain-containing protein [Catenaria anguillulae PL171]|uniref:7 transmembrane sweet-taste receptor of 3 GCPR-domain-containing protein n=1 Tax=Catenaria anguillulae PL171 TaxID=765915 RepID=A0A1Y2HTW7_9FUNG|nr:7 transmembrane sweet-taste receptor of 3 GCPR-domain-containing protein [Catenaria anguillulae PL171]